MRNFYNQQKTSVKFLIGTTLFLSVLSTLLSPFFSKVLHISSPQSWLALNSWGLHHFYIWQFFTHFLFEPMHQGMSLGFIISILLDGYILWSLGSFLSYARGSKHLLGCYIGGGIFAGLAAWLFVSLTHSFFWVAGPAPAIYALLTCTSFMTQSAEVRFSSSRSIKSTTILLVILGLQTLGCLSEGRFVEAFYQLAGVTYGYLYKVLVLQLESPWKGFASAERKILSFAFLKRNRKSRSSTIIYDAKTKKEISSWKLLFRKFFR